MLRPTNAGNTMTFFTITTFNKLQLKPLVCTASPLPPSWAVLQRNSLTFSLYVPRERQWLHQRLSLAVVRGNTASILACVQVWSDFSHLQCITMLHVPACHLPHFNELAIAFRIMSVFSGSFSVFSMFFYAFCKASAQYCFAPHLYFSNFSSDRFISPLVFGKFNLPTPATAFSLFLWSSDSYAV